MRLICIAACIALSSCGFDSLFKQGGEASSSDAADTEEAETEAEA